MSVQYEYPLLANDYEYWNMKMKLCSELGIPFNDNLITAFTTNSEKIWIHCTRELTAQEKAKVDTFMADVHAGHYPVSSAGYKVFRIGDLVANWNNLSTASGCTIKYIFWDMPNPGDMEIWVSGTPSKAQINAMKSAYASLISEK